MISSPMDINNKPLLYKIVCARDKRYDGRFYCGVHTTGIYCRPICPARPKIENITFYRSSAEAEKAGFRACLRCRPDLAPNSAQWSGTAAIVGRALSLISRGEADDVSFEHFAKKLGVSDRHLRRLFEEHIGASPIEVATSKRLHLAKQLLMQSNLSITDIAFASGYQSIRNFNYAFNQKFRMAPRLVRKSKDQHSEINKKSNLIHIKLPVIEPFDWEHIFEFLKNHQVEGVESFIDGRYQRSFLIDKAFGAIDIGYEPKKQQLSAKIFISDPNYLRLVVERIRDLFDTRLNPHSHLNDLDLKDSIVTLYKNELGIRIPGAWDSFETAVCIILGQLVSVEQARSKVKRLIEKFGTKISNPIFSENRSYLINGSGEAPRRSRLRLPPRKSQGGTDDGNEASTIYEIASTYLFPSPRILAEVSLKDIGVTKVREHALRELSKLVFENKIDLSRSTDIEKTRSQLLAIKGIGPWTTEMIAMRCLGDTNAFPATDLIVKRALQHHKNEKGDWSPWNAYIALALWKKYAIILSNKSKKRKSSTK